MREPDGGARVVQGVAHWLVGWRGARTGAQPVLEGLHGHLHGLREARERKIPMRGVQLQHAVPEGIGVVPTPVTPDAPRVLEGEAQHGAGDGEQRLARPAARCRLRDRRAPRRALQRRQQVEERVAQLVRPRARGAGGREDLGDGRAREREPPRVVAGREKQGGDQERRDGLAGV